VEDEEGKIWRCSGWYGSEPYVSVEPYVKLLGTINDK